MRMNVVWPRQGVVYRERDREREREVSLFQLRLRAAAQQREMCPLLATFLCRCLCLQLTAEVNT